ncbi:DedA family protein [Streptacidiphilus jiangxiensis]|uniref:Membrane-associated protein n=1 Tax=Streptacidiphilus jiangxiensis TaxID=235985 RepID=A0A1H7JUY4_STRJI|nr:VTT domain-containing protein [Streptacidiphilus jiangxiensis]SEK77890.1 membrane-associated protein [Streptacidiphilus jiangxiensis]
MTQNLALSLSTLLDAKALIAQVGVYGLLAIVFAETGLLIGFFLPGDSLLILGGVAASGAGKALLGTQMSIGTLLVGAPICAIAGAQLGHLLGAKVGSRLFDRPNSKLFKRDHVVKAEQYFNRFGPAKAVVMARFVPVVRTFLNPVAGTLEMPARTFFVWNAVGGLVWTEVMLLIGWKFGDSMAPVIDKYLIPAVLLIVLLSVIPIVIEMVRGRREGTDHGAGEAALADGPAQEPFPVAAGRGGRHRKR